MPHFSTSWRSIHLEKQRKPIPKRKTYEIKYFYTSFYTEGAQPSAHPDVPGVMTAFIACLASCAVLSHFLKLSTFEGRNLSEEHFRQQLKNLPLVWFALLVGVCLSACLSEYHHGRSMWAFSSSFQVFPIFRSDSSLIMMVLMKPQT